MSHTPGQWEVLDDLNYARGDISVGKGLTHHVICNVAYMKPIEERNNNARLIAAAPETAMERDRLKNLNRELVKNLETLLYMHKVSARVFSGEIDGVVVDQHKTALYVKEVNILIAKAKSEGKER